MEGEEQLELLSGAGVLAFGLTRQAITNAARHADPTRGDVAAARTGEELACFVYVLATESFSCRSWVTESVTKCGKSGDWEQ